MLQIPVWCRNLLGFYTVEAHPTALRTWITGSMARFMETLELDYVKESCAKVIRKFVGHVYKVTEPTTILRTNWYTNPYIRGSYSYRTIESERSNVWARDLAIPILNFEGKPVSITPVLFINYAT